MWISRCADICILYKDHEKKEVNPRVWTHTKQKNENFSPVRFTAQIFIMTEISRLQGSKFVIVSNWETSKI